MAQNRSVGNDVHNWKAVVKTFTLHDPAQAGAERVFSNKSQKVPLDETKPKTAS